MLPSGATAKIFVTRGRVFGIAPCKSLDSRLNSLASAACASKVDMLPERGHAEVICLPKKGKTDWNFCKGLWTC